MSLDYSSAVAANRFGLGARPGELELIGADARGWLEAQLRGPAPALAATGLRPSADILSDAAVIRQQLQALRRARAGKLAAEPESTALPSSAEALAAVMRLPQLFRPIYIAEVQARLRNAVATERPLVERLVYFWSNHFAVSVDKLAVLGIAGSLEREAIRPHVLGQFQRAAAGGGAAPGDAAVPGQPALRRTRIRCWRGVPRSAGARSGLNENLAREILELHTLGVDARLHPGRRHQLRQGAHRLVARRRRGPARKRTAWRAFMFRPAAARARRTDGPSHAAMTRRTQAQGARCCTIWPLAPPTARHIATKLARHFIADDPPAGRGRAHRAAFERSGGDLPAVYARADRLRREAWETPLAKFKTPQDYLLSLYRGLQLPAADEPHPLAAFDLLGQRQFAPGSPAGWPDRSYGLGRRLGADEAHRIRRCAWRRSSATGATPLQLGAAAARGQRYSDDDAPSLARAASDAQALTLLLTAPEFLRR